MCVCSVDEYITQKKCHSLIVLHVRLILGGMPRSYHSSFSLGIQLLESFFLELRMTPPAAPASRKPWFTATFRWVLFNANHIPQKKTPLETVKRQAPNWRRTRLFISQDMHLTASSTGHSGFLGWFRRFCRRLPPSMASRMTASARVCLLPFLHPHTQRRVKVWGIPMQSQSHLYDIHVHTISSTNRIVIRSHNPYQRP